MLSHPITTPRLMLRNLSVSDVDDRYLGWLNDVEVTRFLEVRFGTHSAQSTGDFIDSVNRSQDTILFGLFLRENGLHIGNIKLGPVNPYHARAEIGLMLGERSQWGKGFASEAIAAVTTFGFNELELRKISAGCYEENIGSLKAFFKAGFQQEARLPDHWHVEGKSQAQLLLGLSRSSDISSAAAGQRADPVAQPSTRYGQVESITFIGGGALMVACAQRARKLGYRVGIVLAPRHATETLPDGSTVEDTCRAEDFHVAAVDDINCWKELQDFPAAGLRAMALCFGPAWVFSSEVISRFGSGMLNFNGIPIPHYLGGAHYTWQILNGNRSGGCFLQDITMQIDRGDVLRHEYFELPAHVRTPSDYFDANFEAAFRFLAQALEDMRADAPFYRSSYDSFDARRLYFPRLFTKENAYIDWRWSGEHIERFCNAFDAPYMGAATFWQGHEIRLRDVGFEPLPGGLHPYTSGLIVRKHRGSIWAAAGNGLLKLGQALLGQGESAVARIKEGDRLATPAERLWHAALFSPKFTGTGLSPAGTDQTPT